MHWKTKNRGNLTHAEWLKFLRTIDRETPKGKTLHLIVDNPTRTCMS